MTTPQDPNQPQGWGQQQPGPGQPTPQGQQSENQPPQNWQPQNQQPPQGQPQGQPWGAPQQPGQPGQPGQPWAGAGAQGQVEQPKKRGLLARVGGAVVAVVVAGIVFALIRSVTGGPSAEVGDCVNAATDEIGVVDCDDSDAAFRVLGVIEDTTSVSLSIGTSCSEWASATSYAFEGPRGGGEGTGYCLEPIS